MLSHSSPLDILRSWPGSPDKNPEQARSACQRCGPDPGVLTGVFLLGKGFAFVGRLNRIRIT